MLTSESIFVHQCAQRPFQDALERVPGAIAIPLSIPTPKPGREYLVTATAQDLFQLGVYFGYGIVLHLIKTTE